MTAAQTTVTHVSDDQSVISVVLDAIRTAAVTDGDLSRLSVKRVEGGKVVENCFSFSPLEVASIFDRVRQDHGGGMYEVWVLTDKKQIAKRISFEVESQNLNSTYKKNRHDGHGSGDFERLDKKIDAKFGQIMNRLNSNNTQQTAQLNPLELIKWSQEVQEKAYDRAKSDFGAKSTSQGGDFHTEAEKFCKTAEYMGFVMPGEADKDQSDPWGLAKVAETLKPEFGELVGIIKRKYQQPGQPGQPGQPAQPALSEEEANEAYGMMLSHINLLAEAGSRGDDPGLYADLTIARFGGDVVREWIKNPDLSGQLTTQFPQLTPYEPWLLSVLDEIAAAFEDENEEEDENTSTEGGTGEANKGGKASTDAKRSPGSAKNDKGKVQQVTQ